MRSPWKLVRLFAGGGEFIRQFAGGGELFDVRLIASSLPGLLEAGTGLREP